MILCVCSNFARFNAAISMLRPDGYVFAGASSSSSYSIVNAGDHGSSRSASSAGGIHTSRRECCMLVGLFQARCRQQTLLLLAS